jgi:hypothetical protein
VRNKFRIGKNAYGWFVAVPRNTYPYSGYDVIEDVGSFEAAVALFNHIRWSWSSIR